jgi:hypothetical protein
VSASGLRDIHSGYDAIGGQVHYADFVRRTRGKFLKFQNCGLMALDSGTPERRAIGHYFKDVVVTFHSGRVYPAVA